MVIKWQGVYLDYLKSLKNYETTVNGEGGGLSISYKRAEKIISHSYNG